MTHPLKRRIGTVRNRVRRLVVVYGLSWVLGAAVTAVLVLGLADYLLRFQDRGIRIICWLTLLGAVGWTCYRRLLLGLNWRLSDVAVARRLQRQFPKLGDSLASAVEFLGQGEDDPNAGSLALRRAVIVQTTAETDRLDFREALARRPAVRAALISMGICLVASSFVFFNPAGSRIAVARLMNPFSDVAWPQVHHLALLNAVTRVARGQAFEVEVADRYGRELPSDVRIYYRYQNPDAPAIEESERMRFIDGAVAARRKHDPADPRRSGVMVARRENVTRPFAYRVAGGDDHSMPWIPVDVLEPPALESLSIKLIPPEYTGWPSEEAQGHIQALVGTRARVSAKSTKPLKSAYLGLEGGQETECRLTGRENGNLSVDFTIERSGAYWLRLTDVEDVIGGTDARWEIRAVPDAPPTVSIEWPTADLFVTPEAQVPLRIMAKDDLAIRRIELASGRSDRPEEGESVISLYTGPDRVRPQPGGLSSGGELGQSVPVDFRWQLGDLGLQPGSQVTFHAKAMDYRPGSGLSEPRRLIIITPEDLAQRIADRQTSILSELSRVLEIEQQVRRRVGDLEIRLEEVGRLDQLDLDRLRGAELNQRQVRRTLTSRGEGVLRHVLALLADLENNKVDSPDVYRRMHELLETTGRLDREHLTIIGRELTSAVKAVQVRLQEEASQATPPDGKPDLSQSPQPDPLLAGSLATAGEHQDRVIASLEQMLDQLGLWDRYRRFHSRIADLLRQQEQLRESTKQLGQRTLTKDVQDLLPQESAELKILARRQFDLAGELDKIQQDMQQAVAQLDDSNPLFAETVSDALHRAVELAISGQMRSAAGSIQRNQMGQAVVRQEEVIEALREILNVLVNRREQELVHLVEQLRKAEADLARLAEEQDRLRRQIQQTESLPDEQERRRRLERLSREQEQLEEEARRMARRLERLMAESAGQTTGQAAQKMQQAAASARRGDPQQAAKQAEGAKNDLEDARGQLAQRRRQAEVELALEQMARLEQALQAVHRQQDTILQETVRLDNLTQRQGQLTRAQAASLHSLASNQRLLQTESTALAQKLIGAEVFHLALSRAAGEMTRAAGLLDRRQTGDPTQQAERNALGRLDQLLEALKQEKPDDQSGGSGGGSGGPGQSQGRPASGLQALAELKLLRLMQQEVNRRTRELEEAFGSAETLSDEARRDYAQLGEEQGRLADLLVSLIEVQEDPENDPDALPGPPPERNQDDLPPPPVEEGPP